MKAMLVAQRTEVFGTNEFSSILFDVFLDNRDLKWFEKKPCHGTTPHQRVKLIHLQVVFDVFSCCYVSVALLVWLITSLLLMDIIVDLKWSALKSKHTNYPCFSTGLLYEKYWRFSYFIQILWRKVWVY